MSPSLTDELDRMIKRRGMRDLKSVKVNYLNKYGYTLEDDINMVQSRLFLIETVENLLLQKKTCPREDILS